MPSLERMVSQLIYRLSGAEVAAAESIYAVAKRVLLWIDKVVKARTYGEKRSQMVHQPPSFLGTTPSPEQRVLGKGARPSEITSGCRRADGRWRAMCGNCGPL